MAQIPPIEDAYIDSIIKSGGAYQPSLTKTQGVKLRELMKLLRDRFEQEITTLPAIIGVKAQNFRLSRVYITDNFGGEANAVSISAGELIHFEYSNADEQNVWQLQPLVHGGLAPEVLYYVYCKCSKADQSATYIVTTEEIKPEDEPGFYMFLAGVLYPVLDGYRDSDFTNGVADITGGRIKIGKILSKDGQTGFDLDNGTIFGKITFRSNAGDLKDIKEVETTASKSQTTANDAKVSAETAIANAATAQHKADEAKYQADAAMLELDAIADDGILDVSEKTTILKDYQAISVEYPNKISQANTYGVSTANYTSAYNQLVNYAENIWLVANGQNTAVNRVQFLNVWNYYYSMREVVNRAITDSAKVIADAAQSSANTAITNASNALAQANAAKSQADAAIQELDDISNDGILDMSEKVTLIKDQKIVQDEYPTVLTAAAPYNVSTANYTYCYNTLNYYAANIWFLNNGQNTGIDRAVFNAIWAEYYKARQIVYDAISVATKSIVDSINVGGRNYFKKTTPLGGSGGLVSIVHDNSTNGGYDGTGISNGIYSVGSNTGSSSGVLRISEVIKSNGDWTISGYVKSNGNFEVDVDFCDGIPQRLSYLPGEINTWKYFEYTYNVNNYSNIYNFIDFSAIGWQYFQLQDVKIEKGNKATDWTAAPEDLQASIDQANQNAINSKNESIAASKAYSDSQDALNKIEAAAYADGIVDAEEARAIADAQAKLNQAMADSTAKANAAEAAAKALAQLLSDQNKTLIDGVNFGGVNMLKNSGEFDRTDFWVNGIVGGTMTDGTIMLYADDPYNSPMFYNQELKLKPNTVYTYSAWIYVDATGGSTGEFSSTTPLHFWLGNAFNIANLESTILGYKQYVQINNYTYCWVTFKTPAGQSDIWMRPYVYSGGNWTSRTFATYLQVEESSKPTPWKKSSFQLGTEAQAKADLAKTQAVQQANTFADQVATTKANIAKAAAIAEGQTDAQTRATAAYNSAVSASNAYTVIKANEASSAAQIAAAADASNKANQAYLDAVGIANNLFNQLTASLKGLAYQDFVELSKLGSTVVDNGKIKTVLLEVQAIWANIINAGYITAQQIEALNIAVTNLQAVAGTIGGLTIANNSITSSNGNFAITSGGDLTARSGVMGGFTIAADKLSSGNFTLDPTNGRALFTENSSGLVVASIGDYGNGVGGYSSLGIFVNHKSQFVSSNIALTASALNGGNGNIALDIPNGSIRVAGLTGINGYIKFRDTPGVNGFYNGIRVLAGVIVEVSTYASAQKPPLNP